MSAATARTVVDDDRVRVTTWTFPVAGASTGHHRHEMDYVVIPVTGGRFAVTDRDGTRTMTQVAGQPYPGTAGTEHEVASADDGPVVFVEVELRG